MIQPTKFLEQPDLLLLEPLMALPLASNDFADEIEYVQTTHYDGDSLIMLS